MTDDVFGVAYRESAGCVTCDTRDACDRRCDNCMARCRVHGVDADGNHRAFCDHDCAVSYARVMGGNDVVLTIGDVRCDGNVNDGAGVVTRQSQYGGTR